MKYKKIKTVAIVQARMNSKRLSNKMMLSLHGYPVVEWVLKRLSKSKMIDKTVFAIPDTKEDDLLSNFLLSKKACVVRGAEQNLVGRFIKAAKRESATHIVRVCADNPLIAGSEVDRLVRYFFKNSFDYVYNHIPYMNDWPDGLGAEIASMKVLTDIYSKNLSVSQKEHVFKYIWDNKSSFNIGTFPAPRYLSVPKLKLDVDTFGDYKKLLSIPLKPSMTARKIVEVTKPLMQKSELR